MEELALRDNPFEPRVEPQVDEKRRDLLGNLASKALRVDVCPSVERYYFNEFAAPLEERWREDLELKGYAPGQSRPLDSFAVIVRGKQGSGKTTLASSFIRHLRRCREDGSSEWELIDFSFRDVYAFSEQHSAAEITAGCEEIREQLRGYSDHSWAIALIDNVSLNALGKVLDVFNGAKCTTVFIIVGDDINLLQDNLAGFQLEPPYELDGLDLDAAVAYAKFRIKECRHPKHGDEDLCDAMFPLLDPSIRRLFTQSSATSADLANLLNARMLNKALRDYIRRLQKRFREDDVKVLPPPRAITVEFLRQLHKEFES